MAWGIKIITSILLVLLLVALCSAAPGRKIHQKVRIHVPVKHHTHIITKTRVKTVHIGVPIKEEKKHWDEQWAYSKKRPRVTLPDVDDILDK